MDYEETAKELWVKFGEEHHRFDDPDQEAINRIAAALRESARLAYEDAASQCSAMDGDCCGDRIRATALKAGSSNG